MAAPDDGQLAFHHWQGAGLRWLLWHLPELTSNEELFMFSLRLGLCTCWSAEDIASLQMHTCGSLTGVAADTSKALPVGLGSK